MKTFINKIRKATWTDFVLLLPSIVAIMIQVVRA